MLRRIAIIALLGILGFGAGYASTWLGGHRYYMGTLLWLPRHSAHKPAQIVAMTSGRHPGAQVRASGANKISIEASGTVLAVDNAMRVAYKEVVAANDGKFQFLSYYLQPDGIPFSSLAPVTRRPPPAQARCGYRGI